MIPKAESAYFQYVNAHGGVNGRKIVFKYYDDGYNPANTVPLTKKLVEQDHVFAVYGSLGTAPMLATRDYLNKAKVPQVLVATGDSYWGAQYKKYPWTIGFQPDYPGESRVYGQFINSKVPQAKIGVLMQDDAYGQNYDNGLIQGLGDSKCEDRRHREVRRNADRRQLADREAEGGGCERRRDLRAADADDHGARRDDEDRLASDDVHQQRLGLAAVHGPRAEGGRERRR